MDTNEWRGLLSPSGTHEKNSTTPYTGGIHSPPDQIWHEIPKSGTHIKKFRPSRENAHVISETYASNREGLALTKQAHPLQLSIQKRSKTSIVIRK